jgi:hypothetical protein
LIDDSLAHEICSSFEARADRRTLIDVFDKPRRDLAFDADEWAVRIRKSGVFRPEHFPKAIFVDYRTKPCGQSLLWRKTQVGTSFSPWLCVNQPHL